MGVWGAAQAGAFAIGGFLGASGVDVMRGLLHQSSTAFLAVFMRRGGGLPDFRRAGREAGWTTPPHREGRRAAIGRPAAWRRTLILPARIRSERSTAPSIRPSTWWWSAAARPAPRRRTIWRGRAGLCCCWTRRDASSPAAGAIPPRLIQDFDIPTHLLVARATSARMIAPSAREVDMPIEGGFVGMVDRDVFDEWLRGAGRRRRRRAAHRRVRGGSSVTQDGAALVCYRPKGGGTKRMWSAFAPAR